MALLYTKTRRNASGSYSTDLVNSAGKDWDAAFWLGHGIYSSGRRPCFVNFRGDIYVAGSFSRVLVRHTTDRRMLPAGIAPMKGKLAVVNGALAGGSVATGVLAYVTLLHKEGDRVLAESDRSNVVDVGASTGTGWVWSNLPPTSAVEFRVTHIRGYRSMDGADYRKAWESPIGIPTYTENVLTQNLTVMGAAAGKNGVPPKGCHFMTDFGGRMFYARTAEHPYRMWWSSPGFPQYVDLEQDYVDTWDRSAITGIAKARNELLAFVFREAYKVRQFGQEDLNDFVLVKLDSAVGCVNHFGMIEVHNRLWFPAEDGIWIYDGGFKYLMRDFRRYWVTDYKANPLVFQTGFAYDDKKDKTYVFVTGRDPQVDLGEKTGLTLCGTIAYVGTYESFEPSMGGQNPEPDWTLDVKGRRDSAALYNLAGDVLIGSCDGQIRMHDPTDDDDDGDTLEKELIIRHGHDVYRQPGDDIESGKTLTDFWIYVQAEFNDWTLYLLGGDEDAWNQVRPDNLWRFWKRAVAASLKVYAATVGGITRSLQALPKTVHHFVPIKVSGRGWTVEVHGHRPVGMKYRGFGGSFEPGPAERPSELETGFTLNAQWRLQGDTTWREAPITTTIQGRTDIPVNLEVRSYITDYELVGYPIDLVFTFTVPRRSLPPDATDQIPAGIEQTTAFVCSGLDEEAAEGILEVTATDAGGVPARNNGDVTLAVDVDMWDVDFQYRIDGGAWTLMTEALDIPVTVAQVLEVQVVAYGTRFPTAAQFTFNSIPLAQLYPIEAPGAYLSTVVPYPGVLGTYFGSAQYQDGNFGAPFVFRQFSVTWS